MALSREYTIGIDLGGTNIKAGMLDGEGELIYRRSVATEADGGFEHVFARLVQLVEDVIEGAGLSKGEVLAIGYGTPGPMSHSRGMIYASPNLPGWVNVPLRARFSEATGLNVTLENDANAATFGEFIAGAGRGSSNMVMLTLGTGIGGGIVLDGRLQRGAFENAGELGHTIIVPNGRACPCGQLGCLERYGSANAVWERLVERMREGEESTLKAEMEAGRAITSADVARAAQTGDAAAAKIWDETCLYLALACVNVQHTFNPERVVFGGGLIGAGEQLLGPIRSHFKRQSWRIADDHPSIELAVLGDDAGVIGAAALARAEFGGE